MPITLEPLPYARDALEPYISARTVELHHGKHQAGYVERANKMLEEAGLGALTLEEAVVRARTLRNQKLFENAAQAWNHAFYWKSLRPGGGGEPHGAIAELIARDFDGYAAFAGELRDAALGRFGSGWAWVVVDGSRLKITTTPNADVPLVDGVRPLLTIDVWEHAYYLDYQHQRAAYVGAVIEHLLNWDHANAELAAAN